ncbi:MAG: amidohydrolase family protein [Acetobacterium sp.]|nr:amidohydrolase family protein [Bacillota bacterium]MCG2729694.1 amidohydrolase family protein [Acetobacterium sp.]
MTVSVISAGNFWDGLTDAPVGPREILVQDGVIQEIGSTVAAPPGAERIDLGDKLVMPGLIDAHVHITSRSELPGGFWSYSSAAKALYGAEALKIHLNNGFTTVRDCGDMDVTGYTIQDIKHAVDSGLIEGARLITSGHMISPRGGHMDLTTLLNPVCNATQNCLADGPNEIRSTVRNEIKWEADWIKFAASGGFSSPSDDPVYVAYTQEEMNVLVETAAQQDRPVAAHVMGDEAVKMAVTAGVRSIEHGSLASQETIDLITEKGVFVILTHYAVVRGARFADDDQYWVTSGATPAAKRKVRKYKDTLLETAANFANSEVKLVFGTDLGLHDYGVTGAREFGEMVINGITPVRALKAATSVAAEMLRRDDLGVLAPGKKADIIAVAGNPFADITVMEMVDFVMKAGKVYKSV